MGFEVVPSSYFYFAQSNSNTDSLVREQAGVCTQIESLTIASKPESTGVTDFVQEACERIEIFGPSYVKPAPLVKNDAFQDLTSYLARPRIIATGTLPATRAAPVFSNQVNSAYLFRDWFPPGRFSGVYGIRFKAVFTLQVAATPFHSGIVALSWQYTPPQNNDMQRYSFPWTCTNIPHVKLDVSTDTMVQLHVPYLSMKDFMQIKPLTGDNPDSYGVIAINNFCEFPALTSAAAPTYKLYIHLEDVEFFGALPEIRGTVTLQASTKLRNAEQEFDFEAKPISSGVAALAKVSKWIARGVPSISSYAAPASWFLDKTAGVLRAYGLSKPQIQDPITRIWKTSTACEWNIDRPSPTLMVAPFAENHVPADPAFGATDVDEMSLAFVLSQWNQVYYGNLLTTQPVATVIYGAKVAPSSMIYRQKGTSTANGNFPIQILSTDGANAMQPTGVFFWSQFFTAWRGSIKFRITFAKTKMHAGRVLAAFIPASGPNSSIDGVIEVPTPTVTGVNAPGTTGVTAVFDLKDNNVFEFECPYQLPTPYSDFFEYSGFFSIQVLDPLLAPPTAANYIPFVVEVCAGADYELMRYCGPCAPAHSTPTVRLQASQSLQVAGSYQQPCAGEAFTSAKQLIMLPHWAPCSFTTNQALAVMPWFYARGYPSTVPGPTGNAFRPQSFSPGGLIANCYAFAKGSTDVHVYLTLGEGQYYLRGTYPRDSMQYRARATPMSSTWVGAYTNSSAPWVTERNGVAHMRFPLYNLYQRVSATCLNANIWVPGTPAQNNAPSIWYPFTIPELTVNSATTGAPAIPIAMILGRSAGDDAALSHYMGPPALVLSSTLTNNLCDPDSLYLNPYVAPALAAPIPDESLPEESVVEEVVV